MSFCFFKMESAQCNAVIEAVAAKAADWASLGAAPKLSLLQALLQTLEAERVNWAVASGVGHGYDASHSEQGHLVGETYIKGPAMFGMWVHAIITTYEVVKNYYPVSLNFYP